MQATRSRGPRGRATGYGFALTQGDGQTATVLTAVATAPKVRVTTPSGAGIPGVAVVWTVQNDSTINGVGSTLTLYTDASGYSSVAWILSPTAGGNDLSATVAGKPAIPFTATGTTTAAASIDAVSALSQGGTASGAVSSVPAVIVKDAQGNPYQGQTVTFAVATGGGAIVGGSAVSGPDGIATCTSWTLGPSVGANTCTATSGSLTGSPVTFSANAVASAATQMAVTSGGTQTGITAGAAATAIQVTVKDVSNNPVQGVTVTITTDSGSLSVASGVTDASGHVSVVLTTAVLIATATVRFEFAKADGTIISTTTTVVSTYGVAAQLALLTEPDTNCASGSPLPAQPIVEIRDANTNRVANSTLTITASLVAGDGSISAGATKAAVAGVAVYTNLTVLDTNGGTDTLQFSSGAFSVTAAAPTTVAPPVATKIRMVTQPSAGFLGITLPNFAVEVTDSANVRVPGYSGAVTVAIGTNPPGTGVLGPSNLLTVNCVNGLATFSGLNIDTNGTGYTFAFSDPGGVLTGVTSAAFNITTQSNTHPNEPVGMTQITENDFALPYQAGTKQQGLIGAGWYSVAGGVTMVTTETDMTRLTVGAYRMRYTVNTPGGNAPCNYGRPFTASESGEELYLDFDWKEDPIWSGNTSGVNKMLFITAGGISADPIVLSDTGAGLNTLRIQIRLQGCPGSIGGNGPAGTLNVPQDNAAAAIVTRGVKARIECYFRMNTCTANVANPDGIAQVWLNGTQIYNKSTLAFRGNTNVGGANNGLCGPTALFDQIKVNPTYGGGVPNPPYTQDRWLGYLYASTR